MSAALPVGHWTLLAFANVEVVVVSSRTPQDVYMLARAAQVRAIGNRIEGWPTENTARLAADYLSATVSISFLKSMERPRWIYRVGCTPWQARWRKGGSMPRRQWPVSKEWNATVVTICDV